ncbi:MAG: hypothetical protein ACFBWO_16900 [Paracoccaceae bacterium]
MRAQEGPTFLTRLAVAKMVGLVIGLIGFLLIPVITPDAPAPARWGVLLWYPTMGAVIAMLEVLDDTRSLPWHLPWWLRGALVGAWFNFLCVMVGDDFMGSFVTNMLGADSFLSTAYLFVPEGAAAGTVIAYLVMRFGGEGRAIEDD